MNDDIAKADYYGAIIDHVAPRNAKLRDIIIPRMEAHLKHLIANGRVDDAEALAIRIEDASSFVQQIDGYLADILDKSIRLRNSRARKRDRDL